MSTFGATIVLLLGVVKRVALLKVFSGPLPRPSGQRTLSSDPIQAYAFDASSAA